MKILTTRFAVLLLALVITAALATSCTEQQRARQFGGNATVNLPKGEKLVLATWKVDNLWYLTRPMNDADKIETYTFRESSSFGFAEGTVTIRESK